MATNSRYDNIIAVEYWSNCSDISEVEWNRIMDKAKRGNRREVRKILVKFGCGDMVEELMADNNPYREVYISEEFIILQHSAIEYFFKLTREE